MGAGGRPDRTSSIGRCCARYRGGLWVFCEESPSAKVQDEAAAFEVAAINRGGKIAHSCCPWENGYIESFNCKLRDELLNGEIFYTLREAKVLIERWRRGYNTRPHSALGYRPPAPEAVASPCSPPTVTDSGESHARKSTAAPMVPSGQWPIHLDVVQIAHGHVEAAHVVPTPCGWPPNNKHPLDPSSRQPPAGKQQASKGSQTTVSQLVPAVGDPPWKRQLFWSVTTQV